MSSLLEGCGAAFQRMGGSQYGTLPQEQAEATYQKSRPVERLDYFLSHSWQDSRWHKYMALLWIHNSSIATVVANITAAGWAAAGRLGASVPTSTLTYETGVVNVMGITFAVYAVTYLLLLTYGHHIARRCVDSTVFLDVACIHQLDVDKKVAGIKNIRASIHGSERMIVFWSPHYFQRLWCTYEIACFVAANGSRRIDLVPLLSQSTNLLVMIMMFCSLSGFWVATRVLSGDLASLIMAGMGLPMCALGWELGRSVQERVVLRAQLRDFSMEEAQCWCCQVSHMDGGQPVPCDRSFIMKNVDEWFDGADAGGSGGGGAAVFSAFVRTEMLAHIRRLLGPMVLPRTLKTSMSMMMIFVWYGVDIALLSPDPWICIANAVEFAMFPSLFSCVIVVHCALVLVTVCCRRRCWCLDVVLDIVLSAAFPVLFMVAWVPWDTWLQTESVPWGKVAATALGVNSAIAAVQCWSP